MGGSPPLAKLQVSILEASGLQGKDFFSRTNPYCCASLEAETKQTSVIKNSQNPHWNEDFCFDVFNEPSQVTLVLEVFDKQAIFRDESLGVVELPLAHLLSKKPHRIDRWRVLLRRKKKHRPSGQIHIVVELLPEAGTKFEVEQATEDWVVLGDNFRFNDSLNGKESVSLAMSGEGVSGVGEESGTAENSPPPLPDRDFFYPGLESGSSGVGRPQAHCEGRNGVRGHTYAERKREMPERVIPAKQRNGRSDWKESRVSEGTGSHSRPSIGSRTVGDLGRVGEYSAVEWEESQWLSSDSLPRQEMATSSSNEVQDVIYISDESNSSAEVMIGSCDNEESNEATKDNVQGRDNKSTAEADETEEERLFREFLENELRCIRCQQVQQEHSLVILDACGHRYCNMCMSTATCASIRGSRITEVLCPSPGCSTSVPQFVLKMLLSPAEFEEFINRGLEQVIDSCDTLFRCPNSACNVVIERIQDPELHLRNSSANSVIGLDGKELSEEAKLHREEYRFRCRSCSTEFCSNCSRVPYHLGFTCASYEVYLSSQHCRFCEALLPPSPSATVPPSPCFYVCNDEECREKMAQSCTKLLPCLHPCGGIAGEKHCLPCLQEECAIGDTEAADYCNICWVESLGSAPAVKLACGHIFHKTCVQKKLAERWPSARITFGFWNCPLCKQKMQHPSLEDDLRPLERLHDEIVAKAMQRLKFENLDKSEDIIKKAGKYYRNPQGYAMDRFAYYPCFQCKKAYFGGQRRCDAGDRAQAFKPEDLVCGGCSGADAGGQCPKHGNEFMEHKCQYCCSVATWFCWGKVHFCDACHTRQQKGDYVSKYPREKLPVCPGKDRCPLQLQHPPNGDPYCLGCVICRNTHDF